MDWIGGVFNPAIRQSVDPSTIGSSPIAGKPHCDVLKFSRWSYIRDLSPYPVGYATPGSVKLILELQREHGVMLKQLEELRRMAGSQISEETRARLNTLIKEIMNNLLAHASKEDKKLWPIFRENKGSR